MTLEEWADVLSKLEGQELKIALLALADELESDSGARILRELATREDGLYPAEYQKQPVWITDKWPYAPASIGSQKFRSGWSDLFCTRIPNAVWETLGRYENSVGTLRYKKPSQAWLDLLNVLNKWE